MPMKFLLQPYTGESWVAMQNGSHSGRWSKKPPSSGSDRSRTGPIWDSPLRRDSQNRKESETSA